jgi:hypothetical protein
LTEDLLPMCGGRVPVLQALWLLPWMASQGRIPLPDSVAQSQEAEAAVIVSRLWQRPQFFLSLVSVLMEVCRDTKDL